MQNKCHRSKYIDFFGRNIKRSADESYDFTFSFHMTLQTDLEEAGLIYNPGIPQAITCLLFTGLFTIHSTNICFEGQ